MGRPDLLADILLSNRLLGGLAYRLECGSAESGGEVERGRTCAYGRKWKYPCNRVKRASSFLASAGRQTHGTVWRLVARKIIYHIAVNYFTFSSLKSPSTTPKGVNGLKKRVRSEAPFNVLNTMSIMTLRDSES